MGIITPEIHARSVEVSKELREKRVDEYNQNPKLCLECRRADTIRKKESIEILF